jgi:RNA polymerase sigma factor (sigma-70 family)
MSSPAPTSASLVHGARQRDPIAWKQLVDRYDGMIRDICRCRRLSAGEADEVRQTTWLRTVEHIDRLHNPQQIGSWLATVARNECGRLMRQAERVQPCDDDVIDALPDTRETPDERVLESERRRVVCAALATLSVSDRRLLGLLYHHSEPSYADIGRALGMPVGSIGPTRGRALDRLRRCDRLAGLLAAA